jgi:transcriptional regulator with XRE-family HTH domain
VDRFAAVATPAELSGELELLRVRAGRAEGKRKIGLDDLARRTGLPRSTLHTYLTGRSVPSPDALDRIADALDCTLDERVGLAQALERVVEAAIAARGGRTPNIALPQMWDYPKNEDPTAITMPSNVDTDLIAVRLVQRFGPGRRKSYFSLWQMVRATRDGADGCYCYTAVGADLSAERVRLCPDANCTAQRLPGYPRENLVGHRIGFGRQLRQGEVTSFSYDIDYSAAYVGVPPETERCPYLESDRRLIWALRQRCAALSLEARFVPEELPTRVRSVFSLSRHSPISTTGELLPNERGVVQLSIEQPSTGGHGIAWDW